MTYSDDELKYLKVAKVKCMKEFLFFTRYFFKQKEKKKYIVAAHHQKIAKVLQMVLKGKLTNVIINIAPRYGKTELAVINFMAHAIGINPKARFIHLSFSDSLAMQNSEFCKDIIKSETYRFFFPEVIIRQRTDSKKKWYTTQGGGIYAVSTGGQVTGFGAGTVDEETDIFSKDFEADLDQWISEIDEKGAFGGALVIDDPIKPEDANSEVRRERINERWDSTIKNRVNSRNTPKIIIGQRTHPRDLCGYVMESDGYTTDLAEALENKRLWYVLSIPVINDDGSALWNHKHTIEDLKELNRTNKLVFQTQYMQNPKPKEGLMYDTFRTYVNIPIEEKVIRKCYIDTADKGKDYLCSIIYDETKSAMYVIDVIYTGLQMKDVEPMVANQISKYKPKLCKIESNNGGGNFSREVEKQTRILGNTLTKFKDFHQSGNKEARIVDNSGKATNLIYMPHDWKDKYPIFYKQLTGHMKSGKNLNDDAADTVSGMCENFGKNSTPGIVW